MSRPGSQFGFLQAEFADLYRLASWVEAHALSDPGPAIIQARKALEVGVVWMFENDRSLVEPWDRKLNEFLHTPEFKALAGGMVFTVARKIQQKGNRAVHDARTPTQMDAVEVASALYQFCVYVAFTYGRAVKPDTTVRFDPRALPNPAETTAANLAERQAFEERLEAEVTEQAAAEKRAALLVKTLDELEAEKAALIAEVAAAKKAAEATPIAAEAWSEHETRIFKIDHLLREAGWKLDRPEDREYEVHGMPNATGVGYVDYVLWGADGLPLAIVEAKKTMVSPATGQQQAKLYADCLENQTGQRPVIFTSNGYEHWIWDDTGWVPRTVQGFLTADELARMIARRAGAQPLAGVDVDKKIVERHYQHRAIAAVAERFDIDRQRKALLVMATGAGKTRTVIALADVLMRAGWVRNVLFLADRSELVKQAVGAFKEHLPDSSPVNLVTEPATPSRVYVSTYQTMINKIDEMLPDGTRRFGPGHFDLVIIDEAHRSVYRKYRGIFEYFDSLLVGLTATPRDEIDKNTYDLFDLAKGTPTDVYELDEAISDGYLVPPRAVSVATKFLERGITYDELPDDEKDIWDELDWGDDDQGQPLAPPDHVDATALNKFLFNADTVDKVLETLMTQGVKVAGGDRLGKTIIFAKNQQHAEFIYQRFIANYPHLDAGNFARVITHDVKYASSLIDDFKKPTDAPHIAISVDMLDTGVDVPEVVNLVFFKLVRSRIKFWQMLGRGTRLCADLFGPGENKTHFDVFDFCGNLEYFSQAMAPAEGSDSPPLSERIFTARLELLATFDGSGGTGGGAAGEHAGVWAGPRADIVETLRGAIASMNHDNFLVRPHLELVERFTDPEAWKVATIGDYAELATWVAGLPTELPPEDEHAKRFDLLVLHTQLGVLRGEPYERQRRTIIAIAGALEDQPNIPVIAAQLELIQQIQTDEWWIDVTYPMLEEVRRKLRNLVQLIERSKKNIVYTDFADTLGDASVVTLPGTGGASEPTGEYDRFRAKAEHFLTENLALDAVAKVRSGEPLTKEDLAELQRILVAAGIGGDATFAEASERAGNFGLFIRSLVGLDRAAAVRAFAGFLDDKHYSANQIRFVQLVIDELTRRGVVEAARVYESPYDAVAPTGPEELFTEADLDRLFATLERLADLGV